MILNYILSIDTDTMEFTVKDAEAPKLSVTVPLPQKAEEPRLLLADNKFILNKEAAQLLCVSPGDKVAIVFNSEGVPMIGSSENLKVDEGNKLTKSYTVSFRGKQNEQLARYGKEFTLKDDGDHIGILMIGGKPIEVVDEIAPDEPEPKQDNSIATDIFDLVGSDDDFTMSSYDFSFK